MNKSFYILGILIILLLNSCNIKNTFELEIKKCVPKFKVEKGAELTASQAYAMECNSKTSKEECGKVDVYREATKNFGNPDGKPDCEWV